jgi:hypothetical protein
METHPQTHIGLHTVPLGDSDVCVSACLPVCLLYFHYGIKTTLIPFQIACAWNILHADATASALVLMSFKVLEGFLSQGRKRETWGKRGNKRARE